MYTDTIAAISTPLALGAISIIRLSGPDAIKIADSICSQNLADQKTHTISYGFVKDKDEPVDEVLVSVFKGPRSYTAEDVVEINAHGGPFVTRKILQLLLSKGARLANPGEFTQRAFLNGRIDLSQAEAVEDMIEASSDSAAKMAIMQIRGSIRRLLEPLIEDLLNLIANIEVNIDYPEYDDVEELTFENLLPKSQTILERIDDILKKSSQGQIYKNGIDTAIIGKPNVGKSSLLNALLEEDKAIVTDIAGTTRDIVEGRIHVGPIVLNLIDTAGIHEASDTIEQIGIEKSRQMIEKARLILLVLDASKPLEQEDYDLLKLTENKERIILLNKKDKLEAENPDSSAMFQEDVQKLQKEKPVAVSASNKEIDGLYDRLNEMYETNKLSEEPVLSTERQIALLKNAQTDMMKAIEAMKSETEPDLIEIDLQAAYTHLKEILGEVSREDLLDTLFSNFCLGK